RQRNGVLNYLIGVTGIALASVAAKPQVATNRRCLAQEALRRAWMIDSLVRESRSALRHLRRGAARCVHIADDGGGGVARSNAGSRANDDRHRCETTPQAAQDDRDGAAGASRRWRP